MNGFGTMGNGFMGHMPFFGPLIMIAIVISVITLIVMILRRIFNAPASGNPNAIEIARERFARGEIDQVELKRTLEILGA